MKWCTDITEFRIGEDKLYLSVVQDLFSREIIAWQTASRPELSLACGMLKKALKAKCRKKGLLLHSDMGWHYRTPKWRSMLKRVKVKQSMSRKGQCQDNAVMENFFSHLKAEMYHRKKYDTVAELTNDIKAYMRYYNTKRISQKTGGMSPKEYRAHVEEQE